MFKTLIFAVPLTLLVLAVIFTLNKTILIPGSRRTDNTKCAVAGAILMPLLLVPIIGWWFSWSAFALVGALLVALILGIFSYTLDEVVENAWEMKQTVIPAVIGLLYGGWLVFLMFFHVWKSGNFYLTNFACVNRAVQERFDVYVDSNGVRHESWNYVDHVDKPAFGHTLPVIDVNRELRMGHGDEGKPDRIRREAYYFIGGSFWSEDAEKWRDFRWLLLENPNLHFDVNEVQIVQSNFWGYPIHNGGPGKGYRTPLPKVVSVSLPGAEDLPPPTTVFKAFKRGTMMISLMFAEHEYRPFVFLILGVFVTALLSMAIPQMRVPAAVFLICTTIAVPIVLLAIASKTGGVRNLSFDRLRTGGGGGFAHRTGRYSYR